MDKTQNYSLQKPLSIDRYSISVHNMNMDLIDSALKRIEQKNESQDNLLATKESLNEHINEKNNPHEVTQTQVGLRNVDNTSDINKPVSTAQQNAIDEALYQSNQYTNVKIAELIDGAPETLDTLKEVAEALAENETVAEALDAAIGTKANQTELDTHTGNDVIHVTKSNKDDWTFAKEHADSTHARADATKVEKSDVNGNIKINGIEVTVYTHSDESNNGIHYSDAEPTELIDGMTWIGN